MVIISKDLESVQSIKKKLSHAFEMTDMGEIGQCLGLKITRDRPARKLFISQENYVRKVVEMFRMQDSIPTGTPLNHSIVLLKSNAPCSDENLKKRYQKLVGCVMYAMLGTRIDISYAVSLLSRFMSNPTEEHWTAGKNLLRYLNETKGLTLTLGGNVQEQSKQGIILSGYCDSDWASDKNDRKSTTGYLFQVNGSTISWQSKKQPTVALSTVEAEYMAISAATKEALWLRLLLTEVGFSQKEATKLMEDNQGCIALSSNPRFHERTKHIDIRHHLVRQNISEKFIKLIYTESAKMLADGLTKNLSAQQQCIFQEETGLSQK